MQMEEIKLTSVFEREQNDIFLVKKELFGEPEGFFGVKNTETMQASSPRKKPKFFCSSIVLYAFTEKNARIIYDICYRNNLQFLK